jgi:hypothetical protein
MRIAGRDIEVLRVVPVARTSDLRIQIGLESTLLDETMSQIMRSLRAAEFGPVTVLYRPARKPLQSARPAHPRDAPRGSGELNGQARGARLLEHAHGHEQVVALVRSGQGPHPGPGVSRGHHRDSSVGRLHDALCSLRAGDWLHFTDWESMPDERLRLADYFSVDPGAPDRTYSTCAAVIEGYEFDRIRFR